MKLNIQMTNALWFLLMLCSRAGAQPGKVVAPSQRILYEHHLPTTIRKRMPRDAESCFAGTFKLNINGPTLFLNLYRERAQVNLRLVESDGMCHFTLQLFQQKQTRNVKRYVLIKTAPVVYSGINIGPDTFGAQLLWLDPHQRHIPVLKFDCSSKGDFGPIGDNVLVVFPNGLTNQVAIQSFRFGMWHGSGISDQDNTFDKLDEHGLLEVLATSHAPENGGTTFLSNYKWDGSKFAYTKVKSK